MLEGKEIEGQIGKNGSYSLDVTAEGKVIVEVAVAAEFTGGQAMSVNKVELSLLTLLEAFTKLTETKLDDNGLATVKDMLGLK